MTETIGEMPQYFQDLRDNKIAKHDFLQDWNGSADFKKAVLLHLSESTEIIYDDIVQMSGRVAGYRGQTAAQLFLLSLGFHDIRGDDYILAVDVTCGRELPLIESVLSGLNNGNIDRKDLQITLDEAKERLQLPARPSPDIARDWLLKHAVT